MQKTVENVGGAKDESKSIFPNIHKEFGGDDTTPEYFIKLIDSFICLPSNANEHSLAENNEFNPVQNISTIYTWISNNRKPPRNMNPKIAKAIYDLRDIDKFNSHFEKIATSQQYEEVRNQFRKFHFDATDDDCFYIAGKVLSKVFEFRSTKKK